MTASLENCKKLFKLSGWRDTTLMEYIQLDKETSTVELVGKGRDASDAMDEAREALEGTK